MQVGVMGPAEVVVAGTAVDVGTRKQRALLAALALHRGRPVPVDSLVDLLWSGQPPPGVQGTLQAYVAGLRRALEPDRPARTAPTVLVTVGSAYALRLPASALDVARFERTVGDCSRLLAPTARLDQEPVVVEAALLEQALVDLDEALSLWRGEPFLELEDAPAAVAERARLEQLRLLALESRAVAALGLGDHATVAAELEALTASHPLRERLWALRAVALARGGRQADALDVLAQVRSLLADELGIEPGPELRMVQKAVLRQEPIAGWTPDPSRVRVPAAGSPTTAAPADTATAAPTVTPTAAPTDAPPVRRPQPWPLVGRDEQLAALVDLLGDAESGVPTFACLVGEPGMGKSRLAEELVTIATERGALPLVGRCSQDEGAPPLYPWAGILASLGSTLPTDSGHTDESTRFRSWDDICRTVIRAAADRPVLLVLDDLHWADVSTLRVLSLLLETVHEGRLMVLVTWRDKPAPSGALATVADGLARRHATRLALEGLGAEASADVVAAVASTTPSQPEAGVLQRRTDGNPFFLVEYARLVEDGHSLGDLLAEENPPPAVNDVLTRRIESLPEPTRRLVRTAAVVGRDFDLAALRLAVDEDEDTVLDGLEPAITAGLVHEAAVDRFRFAHALVRDAAYAAVPASRRARSHARLAAALEARGGRESEVARHWSAAGSGYVDRAWRAAVRAAAAARRVYAYDEAEELLRRAHELVDQDTGARAEDRFDVLMELAETLQLAGRWLDLRVVVHQAVAAADALGDVERVARAAVMTASGALWQASHHGQVDPVVVDALRHALDALPPGDGVLRCRVMLSLAGELYYGVGAQEREALAEEALAMARRLADPALRLEACQMAFVSSWRAATAESRRDLADEAVTLSRQLGDEAALTNALTVRAVVAGELGDIARMEELSAQARLRAEQRRQLYPLAVLDSMEIAWCAMRGEWAEAVGLIEHLTVIGERMSLPQLADAIAGARLSIGLWQGEYDELVTVVAARGFDGALPIEAPLAALLVRTGRTEEARALLADSPVDFDVDTWFSPLPWALAAEAALGLADAALASAAYARLAPLAGRLSSAGSGAAMGPVDSFLALAAAASGEREIAARHADDALLLCDTWRIPLAAQWLRDQRDRFGF